MSASVRRGAGTGLTVSVVARAVPLKVAEIVAVVEALTEPVVTVKLAELAPGAIVTVAGTLAAALSLDSALTAPPAGAGLLRVTVPVPDVPPVTVAGFIVTADRGGATDPIAAISASPMLRPVAESMVN